MRWSQSSGQVRLIGEEYVTGPRERRRRAHAGSGAGSWQRPVCWRRMVQARAPRRTRVAIWQSELTSGSALPRICVVTGRPADGWRQYGFPIPPRLGVLLPLAFAMGVVAGLLGAHGATLVLGGGR
jgi:hypothetical protein